MRLLSNFAILILSGCLSAFGFAAEIHVPGDHPTIQAAIDSASPGDTVVVSPGRYNEKIDFLGKTITLRSTNPDNPDVVGATVLDGSDLLWWCVSFTNGEKGDSVIEGFTMTGNAQGGGIYCRDSSPMIAGNTFHGNIGAPAILSIGQWAWLSAPIIYGNTFFQNGTHSVYVIHTDGSALVVRNSFYCNMGPAISTGRNTWVEENIIMDNDDTGILCLNTRSFIVRNTIVGNRAWAWEAGGLCLRNSFGSVIAGNTISGNKSIDWGGGGTYVSGSATIIGNTIVGNSVLSHGGGGIHGRGHIALTNNIITGNRAQFGSQLVAEGSSSQFVLRNCLISRGEDAIRVSDGGELTWGPGNIDGDPLFVDPGHWGAAGNPSYPWDDTFVLGDYHLLPGSPCIDAGTNNVDNPDTPEVETLPAIDIAGLPRIIDGNLDGVATVDIGAYEYLPGDVNYDGRVNVLDLILVRNSLGRDPASSIEARKADVNADGAVNVQDLIIVRGRLGKNQ